MTAPNSKLSAYMIGYRVARKIDRSDHCVPPLLIEDYWAGFKTGRRASENQERRQLRARWDEKTVS